jgi:hypothetical protein
MLKKFHVLLIIAILISSACEKDEIIRERDYPRISLNPTTQEASQVLFQAEIKSEGLSAITKKGFEWRQLNTIINSYMEASSTGNSSFFEARPTFDLIKDKPYVVRAFVQTKDYLVYSHPDTFVSIYNCEKPQIKDFHPKEARPGDSLFIEGENFSFLREKTQILLGNKEAPAVSTTDSLIKLIIPDIHTEEPVNVSVTIYKQSSTANEKFRLLNTKK